VEFADKMLCDTKRLAIYGIVGIIAALPIIATMTFMPWTEPEDESSNSTPYGPGFPNIDWVGYLDNFLIVSNFTEPYGIGSEADLVAGVVSSCDLNATAKVELSSITMDKSSCIVFVGGGTIRSWQVSLEANVSTFFAEKIKIIGLGFASVRVKADVDYQTAPGTILQKIGESVLIGAWEKGILVTKEEPPGAPVNIAFGHSYLTELEGVGSEFNINFPMTPQHYIQNITARMVLPEGLAFLNGTLLCSRGEQRLWIEELDENLTWNGDMEEGTWMRFEVKVRATEVGNWTVVMSVGKCLSEGPWFGNATIYGLWWYGNARVYGFKVFEDKISSWSGDSSLNPYPPCFQYGKANLGDFKIIFPPVVLNITVSDFTEPEGLNSEANLTASVTAKEDILNATVRVWLSEGIKLIDGNLTWSGDLIANTSVDLNVRIMVVELGQWHVSVHVERSVLEDDGIWHRYHVSGIGFLIIAEEHKVFTFPPPPIVSLHELRAFAVENNPNQRISSYINLFAI